MPVNYEDYSRYMHRHLEEVREVLGAHPIFDMLQKRIEPSYRLPPEIAQWSAIRQVRYLEGMVDARIVNAVLNFADELATQLRRTS